MKKILSAAVCCMMILGLMTGCGAKTTDYTVEITNKTDQAFGRISLFVYEYMDDLSHELIDIGDSFEPGETRTFTISLTKKELESLDWTYYLSLSDGSQGYNGQLLWTFDKTTEVLEIIEDKEFEKMRLEFVE